jgi:peptidoglycan/xylan/chitin deacetylase (PgdA/CDA1 family)
MLGLGPQPDLPAGAAAEVEVPALSPVVALTFDDGPRQSTTARLLEGLQLREVPATFFMVGERAESCGDLIREISAAGCQIGVHTYSHVCLAGLDAARGQREVERGREVLTQILGVGDYWLRPPYGLTDAGVKAWADGPLILWSVDPEDWKDRDTERIVRAIETNVSDGDIILLHDVYESSVDAALRVVDDLLAQGWCFVTVRELFDLRGVTPQRGTLYTSLKN